MLGENIKESLFQMQSVVKILKEQPEPSEAGARRGLPAVPSTVATEEHGRAASGLCGGLRHGVYEARICR